MASLFDFSKHIAYLKREKKYADALSFFKENKVDFSNEQITNNEYLISDIISCLRYTNHFDVGFQFLNIYDIQINSDTKERILNAYGWLLWSKYKAENSNVPDNEEEHQFFEDEEEVNQEDNFHYDKNELIERIETIIPLLLELNNNFSKTLISNLFAIVLKSEKKKPTPNWKLVNDFCNHINPEDLSRECSTIQVERKGKMRDMELASDKENWFAYKTKALLKLGEWQECFDKSKDALEFLENFHYSNDIWFARRIALSKKNLGNSKDTISELENILRKKIS
jgi:tetratricopeptide (TPR) repeat protein